MPTTPEAIVAAITDATTTGFRGRLIARGQARAMIWRDGVLPADAPAFAPQLSFDLHSYGYGLLGLGLRLLEMDGDVSQARIAFEQAATALESVMARGDRQEADRHFHFVMAAASYHLAHLSARAYSLLTFIAADEMVKASDCLVLPDGVSPREGASAFINPLSVLGMVETMRRDGHSALVHTAEAIPRRREISALIRVARALGSAPPSQ